MTAVRVMAGAAAASFLTIDMAMMEVEVAIPEPGFGERPGLLEFLV